MPIKRRGPPPKSEIRLKLEAIWNARRLGDPSHLALWDEKSGYLFEDLPLRVTRGRLVNPSPPKRSKKRGKR